MAMMTSEYSQPHQPCVLMNTTMNRTPPSLEFNEHHQVRERRGNIINATSGVWEVGTSGNPTTTTNQQQRPVSTTAKMR